MNVKKSLLFLLIVSLLVFTYSCGGGSGSGYNPSGIDTGEVSKVELSPTRYIAQTNGCINMYARVLDGDGAYLQNIPVTFTNLSSIGQILNKCGGRQVTSATTDSNGLAKVALYSTTPGFSTILAEVNNGAGQIKDRKQVYFTANAVLSVTMSMEVDSIPGNKVYNEGSDLNLFQNDNDDMVEVIATVRDAGGVPVAGESVSWSASHSEVKFRYAEVQTNVDGKAKAIVQVTPSSIRDTETSVNIMAVAGNGAASMVTLFLRPVNVSSVKVSANPSVVAPKGTSDIAAVVMLNTGERAPDGTAVSFTASCGLVTPFSQTTGGIAPAKFTAPSTPGTCRVTASVGGRTGYVDILVTTTLQIQPSAVIVDSASLPTNITFTIFGGVPEYTITRNNPAAVSLSITTVTRDGGTFIATVNAGAPTGDVTITVRDKTGETKEAKITITKAAPSVELTVLPTTQTLINPTKGSSGPPLVPASTATYKIMGGTKPYSAFSNVPDLVKAEITGSAADTLTATVIDDITSDTTITLTVLDSAGTSKQVTLDLKVTAAGGLSVTPSSITLTGIAGQSDGNPVDDVKFYISGGSGRYSMFSSNNAIITSKGDLGDGIHDFTIDPDAVSSETKVTLTVQDTAGATTKAEVTVTPVTSLMTVNPKEIKVVNPTTIRFNIIGGLAPFTLYPSNTGVITISGPNPTSATYFDAVTQSVGSAEISIVDSNGQTVIAKVTVTSTAFSTLAISLDKTEVTSVANPESLSDTKDDVTFTVTGGNPPYSVQSNYPAYTPGSPWSGITDPYSDTTDVDAVGTKTTVTFKVIDSGLSEAAATLDIYPPLEISADPTSVTGLLNPDGNTDDDITVTVTGGKAPYTVSAGGDNSFFDPPGTWNIATIGGSVTIDPGVGPKTITLTVEDSLHATSTMSVTVN